MSRKIVIGLVGLFLLVGGLIWFVESRESMVVTTKKQTSSNWSESYELNRSNPRNLSFLMDLLKAHTKDSIYVLDDWKQLDSFPRYQQATYLFVGEEFGLSTPIYDSLLGYVAGGATLYISFDHLTSNIYPVHFQSNAFNWDYNNKLYAEIGDTILPFYHVYQNDTLYADWYTFEETRILDTNYRAYFFAFQHAFAFEQDWGEGKIHFHSVPRLFENVQVIQRNGFEHVAAFLKKIPKDRPVIFLTCADYSRMNFSKGSDEEEEDMDVPDRSLIQFILSSPYLRLAFILLLLLLIVFVLFRGKRRQNVLPGYQHRQNQTLSYIETLTSIYVSRNTPLGLLQLLRKNFYLTINRYFYIDLSKESEYEQNVERLLQRVNVDSDELAKLLKDLKPRGVDVDMNYVVDVQRRIRAFHIEMGILTKKKQFATSQKELKADKSLLWGASGLLLGVVLLTKGLQLLSMGVGVGLFFVFPALLILFLASRFMRLPLVKIQGEELVVYGLFFGKKSVPLNQKIHCVVEPKSVAFHCEDGTSFTIRTGLLSQQGRAAIQLFVEHIKNSES